MGCSRLTSRCAMASRCRPSHCSLLLVALAKFCRPGCAAACECLWLPRLLTWGCHRRIAAVSCAAYRVGGGRAIPLHVQHFAAPGPHHPAVRCLTCKHSSQMWSRALTHTAASQEAAVASRVPVIFAVCNECHQLNCGAFHLIGGDCCVPKTGQFSAYRTSNGISMATGRVASGLTG
jgi:hypothetical protein